MLKPKPLVGFPGALDSKESACNAGDPSSIPALGRSPWRREWLPTSAFLPGESHVQNILAGYSPWILKESDTIQQLTHTHSPQRDGIWSCGRGETGS